MIFPLHSCVLQVFSALDRAQRKLGFVHADLGMRNVMVSAPTSTGCCSVLCCSACPLAVCSACCAAGTCTYAPSLPSCSHWPAHTPSPAVLLQEHYTKWV